MTDHPITPPPEVVDRWIALWQDRETTIPYTMWFTQAARWGADQELEACCEWLHEWTLDKHPGGIANLRKHRRPKPPSLKEQALMALEDGDTGPGASLTHAEVCIIRRALEALPE